MTKDSGVCIYIVHCSLDSTEYSPAGLRQSNTKTKNLILIGNNHSKSKSGMDMLDANSKELAEISHESMKANESHLKMVEHR